jgi:hypothetical protein
MEEEKDQFYDDVSEEIGQTASDEFVMLLGDLNGHVGANAEGYEGVHGGFGYGVRNEEGCRVLELGMHIAWWWGILYLRGRQQD